MPQRRAIHLILDNYGTHTHQKVEAWFAAHPRYHRHFVPTSTSWPNLIERWFAEITRKRIRRGTFRSVPALIRAIEDYVTHHNCHAEPFLWTASAATILRKVHHCKEALAGRCKSNVHGRIHVPCIRGCASDIRRAARSVPS